MDLQKAQILEDLLEIVDDMTDIIDNNMPNDSDVPLLTNIVEQLKAEIESLLNK